MHGTDRTGGPAFPIFGSDKVFQYPGASGLTVRDYFAAEAMKALIQARASLDEDVDESFIRGVVDGFGSEMDLFKGDGHKYKWDELLCQEAYEFADQMIIERDK